MCVTNRAMNNNSPNQLLTWYLLLKKHNIPTVFIPWLFIDTGDEIFNHWNGA
jgi:hypothetical protein